MTNRGVLGGHSSGWKNYTPAWRSANFAGGAAITTQPDIGNGTLVGRYLRFPEGLVIANIRVEFGSSTTFGTAAAFWEFGLPAPSARSNGGSDLPIGSGYCTRGISANPQFTQPCMPTLADPAASSIGSNSDEDYWVQAFSHRLIAAGVSGDANSPAFTSGATSKTVTHNLGLIGTFTPAAYDINVVATNAPSTNPRNLFVSNVGATTFDVNVGASSTTTPLTYAWKITAEPNSSGAGILIGPNAPWTWASGHSISLQCIYEARR